LKVINAIIINNRIWKSRPAPLNPLNWYCFQFALGHHLFNHAMSPCDEKKEKLVFSSHTVTHVSAQASTVTCASLYCYIMQPLTVTQCTHHLFQVMLPFTLLELITQIKKLSPDKSTGPSLSLWYH